MSKTLISSLEKGDNIGKNIINSYFLDQKNLVRHQIESYDNFLDNKIYEIFHEYNSNPKNIIYSDFDRDLGKNKYEYHIKFDNVTISKPIIQDNQNIKRQMFPNDARLQNLPYSVVVKVDVYHKLVEIQSDGSEQCKEFEPLKQHTIGKIPLMLQSKYCVLSEQTGKTRSEMGECEYDYGGYFIVNGNEKVVIFQERKAENQVFCFAQGKGQTKFSHKCEISSSDEANPYNVKNVEVKLTAKEGNLGKTVKVKIQGMRQELPLFVIFRCLGIVSDKQIMEYIFYNLDLEDNVTLMEMLRPSIREAEPIQDEQTALEYASKYITLSPSVKPTNFQKDEYKLWYVKNMILDELLPHLGKDAKKKAYFLGYMVYRLLYSVVTDVYSERDSFLNKRVDTTGDLMSYLFRTNFKRMMKDVEQDCRKELGKKRFDDLASGLSKKIKKNQIESGMKYALSTGNWGLQNKETKKGIAQVLSRLSYLSFISHLRRMSAPMSKTLKSVDPRVLHGTQWGVVCPFETPEGQPIGLSKNLALMSQVTIGHSTEPIRYFLRKLGMYNLEDTTPANVYGQCKVFINGDWIGIHLQPQSLVKELKICRRKGLINIYTSISWDVETNELYIHTDAGRLCRPLLIVEDNKLKITPDVIKKLKEGVISFDDLFISEDGNSYLEYIDTNEANRCMISLKREDLEKNSLKNEVYYNYTHCEISQDSIFGVVAQTIPLCDHQQAPRVLFYSAQAKQAIGIYATNFEDRFDVMGNSLYYPHRRLLSTDNSEYVNVNKIPNGQNVIVAIAMYGGWNQEDSLIVNKSSLERGMFITSYFRTYIGKEQKNSNTLEEEKFQKPVLYNPNGTPLTAGMREGASYGKLQENGFVKEGTKVDGGDAIIGKVIPLKTQTDDDIKYRDASTFVKSTEKGTVDKVYVNKDGEGFKFAKVRVRSERIPEIGDKYCSSYGQKGTCGIVYTQEDMPFTKNGMTPDLIITPLAIPTRMTIGQLIECVMLKVSARKAHAIDGTPFTNLNPNDIADMLEKCGLERNGTEIMYNGKTGEQMEAAIFVGPTYYHRLKHMVQDKLHSRSSGPYQLLTRQPAEGRAKDGGLRLGEMERDAELSHGAVQFLKERMFDVSDKYFVTIDKKSGMIAPVNKERGIYKSLYSDNTTDFVRVQIPYATKLFIQELYTMAVTVKLYTGSQEK